MKLYRSPALLTRTLLTQSALYTRVPGSVGGPVARLSPTPTALTSGSSTVDATSYATASITPAANQPIYAIVATLHGTSAAIPTCTGNGLTWVQVAEQDLTPRRVTVFRAAGAAPSAGAVTFDCGGVTQLTAAWCVVQFADADVTGTNGSGATVQAVKATFASGTTGTITLAALEHANNVNLTAVINRKNAANIVPDAQFTELAEQASADFLCLEVQWARGETPCTPTWTSDVASMISVEVKAA